jgi:hypothetical protein
MQGHFKGIEQQIFCYKQVSMGDQFPRRQEQKKTCFGLLENFEIGR